MGGIVMTNDGNAILREAFFNDSLPPPHMDVEPKIEGFYPPKWMVKIMENPIF